jgi:hypothetical protein
MEPHGRTKKFLEVIYVSALRTNLHSLDLGWSNLQAVASYEMPAEFDFFLKEGAFAVFEA